MRKVLQAAAIAAIVLVAGGVGVFVWPTPYRPIPIAVRGSEIGTVVAARQNRLSGRVEWLLLGSSEWTQGGGTAAATPSEDPGAELARLADRYGRAQRPQLPVLLSLGIAGVLLAASGGYVFGRTRRR